MRTWLFKSEPETYSWDDLVHDGRTEWEGVRNYQARNLIRDEMKVGDLVFFYHSRVQPQVIAGVARIVREAYPDHHALNPASPYHDPRATPDDPVWMMVDIEPVRGIEPPITRDELKQVPELDGMMLLKRGARLSVQPVTPAEWGAVLALRGLDADTDLGPRE
jgi:predicted RNA-binding protein with PUA-like domain